MPLLLGYDIGTSSIKASLLDAESGCEIASAAAPAEEMEIISTAPGFAEQHPDRWWEHLKSATAALAAKSSRTLRDVSAIGITYQMHGLVVVDRDLRPLRPAIIWCDGRAVPYGDAAYQRLGEEYCRSHTLNSPGNFTAAKLRWVREQEPELFARIHKAMLPGDYIAMSLTGAPATSETGLSEMVLWDFHEGRLARDVLRVLEIPEELLPPVVSTFGEQGRVTKAAADALGLTPGAPVTYRAGDQPNNAFSLNVLSPGDVAATAGTSGVVYGVSTAATCDSSFRVNTFLHVNSTPQQPRLGVLLCVNGVGILNSWLKKNAAESGMNYSQMNELAGNIPIGSGGLIVLPYGNGSERTLNNKDLGAAIHGLRLTTHTRSHLFRAAQEGIVFALNYGLEIMRGMDVHAKIIRAGNANMFRSPVFCSTFSSLTGAELEIVETDGAQGAARAAGVGVGVFADMRDAFRGLKTVKRISPDAGHQAEYQEAYERWRGTLLKDLENFG